MGTANIAKKYILPTLLEMKDKFRIHTIASRDFLKASQTVDLFGGQAAEGYENLVNQTSVDLVYIPLPNSLHYEWVKSALENGKHVLVEKSLTCSYEQTKDLCDLAMKKKKLLIENFQFLHHAQTRYIDELIQSGYLGDIRCFRSCFGFPPLPPNDIRYSGKLGGGALLDVGAYPIKATQVFVGEQIEVLSANLNRPFDYEVDLWGSAMLKEKEKGIISQISFGFDNYYQCNVEFWCSKGKLKADRIFTAPPNYNARVIIETQKGKEEKYLTDNHFKNMFTYIYGLLINQRYLEEYEHNIRQANILSKVKEKSKGVEND